MKSIATWRIRDRLSASHILSIHREQSNQLARPIEEFDGRSEVQQLAGGAACWRSPWYGHMKSGREGPFARIAFSQASAEEMRDLAAGPAVGRVMTRGSNKPGAKRSNFWAI